MAILNSAMHYSEALYILGKCWCIPYNLVKHPVQLVYRHHQLCAMDWTLIDYETYPHFRCIVEYILLDQRLNQKITWNEYGFLLSHPNSYDFVPYLAQLREIIASEIEAIKTMLDYIPTEVKWCYC